MEQTFDPRGLHTRMAAEFVKINALPEPNKSLILDFLQNYRYKKKLSSLARKTRVASQFHFFSKLLNRPMKPFGIQDVKDLVFAIERHESQRKPYSLHTWKELMKNVKIWTKWTNPDDYPTILLKCKDVLTVQNPYSDPKRKAHLFEFFGYGGYFCFGGLKKDVNVAGAHMVDSLGFEQKVNGPTAH